MRLILGLMGFRTTELDIGGQAEASGRPGEHNLELSVWPVADRAFRFVYIAAIYLPVRCDALKTNIDLTKNTIYSQNWVPAQISASCNCAITFWHMLHLPN